MIIVKKSMITGEVHQMDLAVTQEQLEAYEKGMLVQEAFPNLNADEREFILSGITPEEWSKYMKDGDDD